MGSRSPDLDLLFSACSELDSSPTALTDTHAHSFFSDFPFERIFRSLASAGSRDPLNLVSEVLGRLLSTDLGTSMLPGAMPYLEVASSSPLTPLRQLAADQYGKLISSIARHKAQAAGTDAGSNATADADELKDAACLQLVRILTSDSDAGVAATAAKALRQYGSSNAAALRHLLAPGAPVATALAAAASRDAAVRLRVLTLALELAVGGEPGGSGSGGLADGTDGATGASITPAGGASASSTTTATTTAATAAPPEATPSLRTTGGGEYSERLDLLRASGLLQPLLQQLSEASDPLACLAALQLLEDLIASSAAAVSGIGDDDGGVGGAEGVAVVLAGVALPQILNLVSDPLLADAALPLVAGIIRRCLPAALPASAVASAMGNGTAPTAPVAESALDGVGGGGAWQPVLRAAPAILAAVRAVLDERGDASAAAEASGLDAVGTLGQSQAGAQLVLCDPEVVRGLCERSLGRCPHPEVRLAGLHAVASVAGLERAGRERCRTAALLPAQCEEALRRGVFEVASGLRRRPGEVLLGLLQQPFLEMRLAAYRFVAALSLRSWFAVEVVTTPELLDRILSASSESGAAACGWRHAAAAALWATVAAAAARGDTSPAEDEVPYIATLAAPAVAERVRTAVAGGPYGMDAGGGAAAAAAAGREMHEQHFVATRGGGGGV